MYTLIGSPRSRALRVIWMLEELELDYELIPALPRSEEAAAHNVTGKIPVLLVDGQPISESVAIIQFLADRHGKFTAPSGTLERGLQDEKLHFACDVLDSNLWTIAKHSFVYPEDKRVPEAKASAKWDIQNSFTALTQHLGDNPFIAGEEFTVPDIVLGHCAGWMRMVDIDWPSGKASDYFKRLRQRPGFEKVKAILSQN